GTLHGAAGNTLALLRLEPDEALARETATVLARHAFREDGLANWPGSPRPQLARPRDGRICLQWCTGAPRILAGAWAYLDEQLLLAGPELIWRAGAHRDEKGHGLCHGTSGNGFALLKAFARTGDERWLERARRFTVHALSQVERLRAANGRGRYSLWTGDVGAALFAAACLDVDARYPILDVAQLDGRGVSRRHVSVPATAGTARTYSAHAVAREEMPCGCRFLKTAGALT